MFTYEEHCLFCDSVMYMYIYTLSDFKKKTFGYDELFRKSGWSVALKRFDARIQVDSSSLYKEKYPLQIKQYNIAGFYPILRGMLYNIFILPDVDSDSMTVSLTCKSQNLKSANLVMSGISENEKVLYSDTLSVNGYNDWHTYQKNVSLVDVAMMELNIVFAGKDTLRFWNQRKIK